ncbi:hypothetical protein [Stakelama marina]|uniref:Uncharacterized protein n=1 Tax=Stakelama marina TaxID=2826939 RepID=A0A8T4IIT7_9SPHN|nr:hypothetical protein [Stakelama marina]MBR0552229.1 hypothetical protein [Stakelama marina]
MRVLIEILFLIGGLIAALTLGYASAWAYPIGTRDIWLVTDAAMVVIVAMGVAPIWRAYRLDRARLRKDNIDG